MKIITLEGTKRCRLAVGRDVKYEQYYPNFTDEETATQRVCFSN